LKTASIVLPPGILVIIGSDNGSNFLYPVSSGVLNLTFACRIGCNVGSECQIRSTNVAAVRVMPPIQRRQANARTDGYPFQCFRAGSRAENRYTLFLVPLSWTHQNVEMVL
jgi:hypothetical protein